MTTLYDLTRPGPVTPGPGGGPLKKGEASFSLKEHQASLFRIRAALESQADHLPFKTRALLVRSLTEIRTVLAAAIRRSQVPRNLTHIQQSRLVEANRDLRSAANAARRAGPAAADLARDLSQLAAGLQEIVAAGVLPAGRGSGYGRPGAIQVRPTPPARRVGVTEGEPTNSRATGDRTAAARAAAHVHARFDGYAPRQPLIAGVRAALVVWVGPEDDPRRGAASAPFAYRFPPNRARVEFRVTVEADSPDWVVKPVEPALIVARPGQTVQEAEFQVMSRAAGRCRLYINIQRGDTGADVQHLIMPIEAMAPQQEGEQGAADVAAAEAEAPPAGSRRSPRSAAAATLSASRDPAPLAQESITSPDVPAEEPDEPDDTVVISRPLDDTELSPSAARLLFVRTGDAASYHIHASVESQGGRIEQRYEIPLTIQYVQAATQRLREELENVALYRDEDGYLFADPYRLAVDESLARQAVAPLARAGQVLWAAIFTSREEGGASLRELAADLRALPAGSTIRIDLDDTRFIVPWTLLYDAPGDITAETLDWSGFWGYRYALSVLLPGRYPKAKIPSRSPVMRLLLHSGAELERFTAAQIAFLERQLRGVTHTILSGPKAVEALEQPWNAAMLYCYCHGSQNRGERRTWLPTDVSLIFGDQAEARLEELDRRPVNGVGRQPLVFLNACEGGALEAFYYDGFAPYFVQKRKARAFIGTEVKAPQLLAQDFAQRFWRQFAAGRPAADILWELRRSYIDEHHNVLALNYALYGLGDTRLAKPLGAG
ncbi:MAG TPA: hypothetical protein VNL77_15335 [Roseiflexaceae bacterium]|nr:hypothetical protein [Roseiflexaceae bacterium]